MSSLDQLWAKKSIAQIQLDAEKTGLKRSLSAFNLVMLGIGCIIGAGIFVLVGKAAAVHAGPAIMLSFLITAVACGLAGLCYAELASVLPVSGSSYTYTYATLGEFAAWLIGWFLILEYGLAAATVAVGWSGYVSSFLANFGVTLPTALTAAAGQPIRLPDGTTTSGIMNLPAMIGASFISLVLIKGVNESVTVNNIIVAVKLAVIALFIGIGVFYVEPDNLVPFIPANSGTYGEYGVSGVVRAASIIFFAYIGFEAVSTAAAEAKNPQRDMPIGILGSLFVCTIIYMIFSLVLTGIVPFTILNVPDPIAVAVDHIGLSWFSYLIKIGAIFGLTSVMLVLLYGQTRIFYMMSKDGLLPPVMSKVCEKTQTPVWNTVIVGGVVTLAAGFMPLSMLGDMTNLGTLLAFTMVCFSVLYLHFKQPELVRPFKTPFKPFVPVAGMVMCLYSISQLPGHTFELLSYYLGFGIIMYAVYGIKNSKMRKENATAV